MVSGVPVYEFERAGEQFVVCAAQGHLYAVSDPFGERTVYPVFDVEWFPYDAVVDDTKGVGRRIAAIAKLASRATSFINACDYDSEGETIGYNILRYACGGKEKEAKRAIFSTLTNEDLRRAFDSAKVRDDNRFAMAGRTRHLIDFIWGVNLSRALASSLVSTGHGYRTISIGRVQGPTLNFVAEREMRIRSFVPSPYWIVRGVFKKAGIIFEANYSKNKIRAEREVRSILRDCTGKEAVVSKIARSSRAVPPPPAFSLGDLQREAYRVFGYAPNKTLSIAERLYLNALISYPRTGSQKLPQSIDYRRIMLGLANFYDYAVEVGHLNDRYLKPVQGTKDDPAHPAIYPTGEKQKGRLSYSEGQLFDLIARRFLAAFAPAATRESTAAEISVGNHRFVVEGQRTVVRGWLGVYMYSKMDEMEAPALEEGEFVELLSVESEEKFEQPPTRYTQGSLLEKMERENIGTKATRAEIITTLINRGYISGDSLVITELGLGVIETMARVSPNIISAGMTKLIEAKLEQIEAGTGSGSDLVLESISLISSQLNIFNSKEQEIGRELVQAARAISLSRVTLGSCPLCRVGKMIVVRSRKTNRRFVGCTQYPSGCKASAPLPQKGMIRATGKVCRKCSWPIIYVILGKRPWRLCVNAGCPLRAEKHEMRSVRKRS